MSEYDDITKQHLVCYTKEIKMIVGFNNSCHGTDTTREVGQSSRKEILGNDALVDIQEANYIQTFEENISTSSLVCLNVEFTRNEMEGESGFSKVPGASSSLSLCAVSI